VRAFEVVVLTPEVTVVRRLRVDVAVEVFVVVLPVVDAVVEDLAAVDELDAAGCSGAFEFCTCVDANAVIPESDVSVIAVAKPRRIALERMRGFAFERLCMRVRRPFPRSGRVSFV
jgi:hypothetical protein